MSKKQYSKELKLELVKKHLEDGISYWKLGKDCINNPVHKLYRRRKNFRYLICLLDG